MAAVDNGCAAYACAAGDSVAGACAAYARYVEKCTRGRADGTKAVLMGLAAHRSIDEGRPVLWDEMLAEVAAARGTVAVEEVPVVAPAAAAAP